MPVTWDLRDAIGEFGFFATWERPEIIAFDAWSMSEYGWGSQLRDSILHYYFVCSRARATS